MQTLYIYIKLARGTRSRTYIDNLPPVMVLQPAERQGLRMSSWVRLAIRHAPTQESFSRQLAPDGTGWVAGPLTFPSRLALRYGGHSVHREASPVSSLCCSISLQPVEQYQPRRSCLQAAASASNSFVAPAVTPAVDMHLERRPSPA